jgi:hypothetical protein
MGGGTLADTFVGCTDVTRVLSPHPGRVWPTSFTLQLILSRDSRTLDSAIRGVTEREMSEICARGMVLL